MKKYRVLITRASNLLCEEKKEMTLNELLKWMKKNYDRFIIEFDVNKKEADFKVIIYNDYME